MHLPGASASTDALPAAGRSWPAGAGESRGPEVGFPHATATEVAAMPYTNITEDHRRTLEALASGTTGLRSDAGTDARLARGRVGGSEGSRL